MLQFNVESQRLTRIDDDAVVQDSIWYQTAKFKFNSDWDGLDITALFYPLDTGTNNTPYTSNINSSTLECNVPNALYNQEMFYVSVVGVKSIPNGTQTPYIERVTTNLVKVVNKKSGWYSGTYNSLTTNNAFTTFSEKIADTKTYFENKYDKKLETLQSDLLFHAMNDWTKSNGTDNTVYNHERKDINYNTTVKLEPCTEYYSSMFTTIDNPWLCKSVDGNYYETEYYFEMTMDEDTTEITFTFDDDEIDDIVYITNDEYEKNKTYAFSLRDGICVVTEVE